MRDPFSFAAGGIGFGEERKAAERRARQHNVTNARGQPMVQALAAGAAGRKALDIFRPKEEMPPTDPMTRPLTEKEEWLKGVLEACDD